MPEEVLSDVVLDESLSTDIDEVLDEVTPDEDGAPEVDESLLPHEVVA